jgi:hypothetical protein
MHKADYSFAIAKGNTVSIDLEKKRILAATKRDKNSLS